MGGYDEIVRFRIKPEHLKISSYKDFFHPARVYTGYRDGDDVYVVTAQNPDARLIAHMKDVSLLPSPAPVLELHQSDADDLWSCPRKFYYSSVMGLQPVKTPPYFTVGRIYHAGIALMRNPCNVENEPDIDARFVKMNFRMVDEFNDEYPSELAEAMKYLELWKDQQKTAPMPHKVQYVEVPLSYQHPSWPGEISIGGTMDAIMLDARSDRQIWSGEWKTARTADIKYFRNLKHGPQPAWYYMLLIYNLPFLALQRVETVRGTVFEVLKKTHTSGRPPVVVESMILDGTTFERGVEFINASVHRAKYLMDDGSWPRVLASCYGKYNQECTYMPWCYRKGDAYVVHDALLGSMFSIVPPKEALESRQNHAEYYVI